MKTVDEIREELDRLVDYLIEDVIELKNITKESKESNREIVFRRIENMYNKIQTLRWVLD